MPRLVDGGREECSDGPLLALSVTPSNGELKLPALPPDARDGATLAIGIEPIGGSPTQRPT